MNVRAEVFAKRYRNGINSQEQPKHQEKQSRYGIIKYLSFQQTYIPPFSAINSKKIFNGILIFRRNVAASANNIRNMHIHLYECVYVLWTWRKRRRRRRMNSEWMNWGNSRQFYIANKAEGKLSKRLSAHSSKWTNSQPLPLSHVYTHDNSGQFTFILFHTELVSGMRIYCFLCSSLWIFIEMEWKKTNHFIWWYFI